MSYLREAILEYADGLDEDTLVSISERIHNQAHAKDLRDIVKECDRLDDV